MGGATHFFILNSPSVHLNGNATWYCIECVLLACHKRFDAINQHGIVKYHRVRSLILSKFVSVVHCRYDSWQADGWCRLLPSFEVYHTSLGILNAFRFLLWLVYSTNLKSITFIEDTLFKSAPKLQIFLVWFPFLKAS